MNVISPMLDLFFHSVAVLFIIVIVIGTFFGTFREQEYKEPFQIEDDKPSLHLICILNKYNSCPNLRFLSPSLLFVYILPHGSFLYLVVPHFQK